MKTQRRVHALPHSNTVATLQMYHRTQMTCKPALHLWPFKQGNPQWAN